MLCAQFYCNSPRVGLDSHFSGGSVSFRDYTPLVKINMYAPGHDLGMRGLRSLIVINSLIQRMTYVSAGQPDEIGTLSMYDGNATTTTKTNFCCVVMYLIPTACIQPLKFAAAFGNCRRNCRRE
jgi:hypothetical protein